ncbi:hypothetical protein OHA77_34220 [Streptosporangium sp. NBC_01639]|uniref:hypothetical protein n=1 Tax=Streptosporangium sp. NBC_01639 TaxID=2975948 RepID=UPI00386F4B2E|nr:hypothetical protein OHA77_34220 [Streptosporangium sp. NBC_01639]
MTDPALHAEALDLLSLQEGGDPILGVMFDLHGDMVGAFSGTALVDSTAYDPFSEVAHRSGAAREVLVADGTQKYIEEVEGGDHIIATDPETGKSESRIVSCADHRVWC